MSSLYSLLVETSLICDMCCPLQASLWTPWKRCNTVGLSVTFRIDSCKRQKAKVVTWQSLHPLLRTRTRAMIQLMKKVPVVYIANAPRDVTTCSSVYATCTIMYDVRYVEGLMELQFAQSFTTTPCRQETSCSKVEPYLSVATSMSIWPRICPAERISNTPQDFDSMTFDLLPLPLEIASKYTNRKRMEEVCNVLFASCTLPVCDSVLPWMTVNLFDLRYIAFR